MYICEPSCLNCMHVHVCISYLLAAPSVKKSRKQKKYAQTFATSACVNSLFGTCKEHTVQHKYFKALYAAALLSHITRQQPASNTLIRNAIGLRLSAVLCFFALFCCSHTVSLVLVFWLLLPGLGLNTGRCSTTRVCFFPRLRRATTVRLYFCPCFKNSSVLIYISHHSVLSYSHTHMYILFSAAASVK